MIMVMIMGALRNLGGVAVVDAPYDISIEISVVLWLPRKQYVRFVLTPYCFVGCSCFSLAIILSFFRFTASDYIFGIFTLFSNIYFTYSLVAYHWLFVIARENVNSDGIHQCQVRLK